MSSNSEFFFFYQPHYLTSLYYYTSLLYYFWHDITLEQLFSHFLFILICFNVKKTINIATAIFKIHSPTDSISRKFVIWSSRKTPPSLYNVATLPCEIPGTLLIKSCNGPVFCSRSICTTRSLGQLSLNTTVAAICLDQLYARRQLEMEWRYTTTFNSKQYNN